MGTNALEDKATESTKKLTVEEEQEVVTTVPRPRYTFRDLMKATIQELRQIAKEISVPSVTTLRRKDDLVVAILARQADKLGLRFSGGTLEILPEGYGFLRHAGLLPSDQDIYVSASQIRRFDLRNGDVVWGLSLIHI